MGNNGDFAGFLEFGGYFLELFRAFAFRLDVGGERRINFHDLHINSG